MHEGVLPEHAEAIAEWLRGDAAVDAGWVDARQVEQCTVVTLHLPQDTHVDRQEVLAFRADLALRRYDPDLASVSIRFEPLAVDADAWNDGQASPSNLSVSVGEAGARPAASDRSTAAATSSALVGCGSVPA
jgi:hypothetical protein